MFFFFLKKHVWLVGWNPRQKGTKDVSFPVGTTQKKKGGGGGLVPPDPEGPFEKPVLFTRPPHLQKKFF
ncbi:hypothetical protein BBP11_11195 [Limosilactobacillus reuteri]|nr:hypothetical protein BBP11_11195 [Limosilactobacillus reuteri]